MATRGGPRVEVAGISDAAKIARLLHDFNTEYDEPTPGTAALEARLVELIDGDETLVLLAGDGPDGLALLRFRPALWSPGLECYLAELYVRPDARGLGLGRALMEAALRTARERGADSMELGTDETDTVARRLYESLGFRNQAPGDQGSMYFYARDL